MLIGIDASRASLQHAGVGRYSLELIQAILAMPSDHHFVLYSREREEPPWAQATDSEWRGMPLRRFWSHLRLSTDLAMRPPDVLFVPGHVLPLLSRVRSLVTVHDLGYMRFPDCHPRGQRCALRLSTAWNARAASHLLADSQATADDLAHFHSVPPERVTVVYPGVGREFHPQAEATVAETRRRLDLPAEYLLYVGTLQPRKNLIRLIDAHGRLSDSPPLVLAGRPGWLSEPILAAAYAAGPRVRLLGPVADEDLPALYSGATGLAFPSLYEGFGFPVAEAMACGTAVLTSNVSSLPEVAGDAAILVDPDSEDAIVHGLTALISADQRTATMREARLTQAARFTWEAAATQALGIIESLA